MDILLAPLGDVLRVVIGHVAAADGDEPDARPSHAVVKSSSLYQGLLHFTHSWAVQPGWQPQSRRTATGQLQSIGIIPSGQL